MNFDGDEKKKGARKRERRERNQPRTVSSVVFGKVVRYPRETFSLSVGPLERYANSFATLYHRQSDYRVLT